MRTGIILLFTVFINIGAYAQRDVDENASTWSWKDRGYFGLGFGGLGFGTDSYYGSRYFTVGVSGLAGFMLTQHVSTGVGLEYQYTSYGDIHLRNNLYNLYPYVRYRFKDFFIQTDYDFYSLNVNLNTTDKQRRVYERFFVGFGYSPSTGGRTQFNFLVSYDILYPNGYVFRSPLSTRFFFTF